MNIGNLIAIASFASSIGALVFALGRQHYRLQVVERDLNNIAINNREILKGLDMQIDKLSESSITISQKISHLERSIYGDDTLGRSRN